MVVRNTDHFRDCPAAFPELADVLLKAGDTVFPAHSQILAMHSPFISQLLAETGSYSVEQPVIIEAPLQQHKPETVKAWLMGVYGSGVLQFQSVQMAWQICLLVDQLDCPSMLQQCGDYVSSNMEVAHPGTAREALEWIALADRLNF